MALALAKRGVETVPPNPAVGAVIVKKDKLIAQGYHRYFGGPHAEIEALRQAKEKARGATLYVTLEPCSHYGKTPPCTDKIISSGIRRVITATLDPNPLNRGRGITQLEETGIETEVGICEEKARVLNAPFFKFMEKQLPFVIVKAAASLDGKIATSTGLSKWITNRRSREAGHHLRSQVDAILVGINTVLRDDPALLSSPPKNLLRIVLDSKLRISPQARILQNQHLAETLIFTTPQADEKKLKELEKLKIRIQIVPAVNQRVNLTITLQKLAQLEIMRLLVEGGGETIASFFETGNVDKIFLFIAPRIIGGRKAITWVEGKGVTQLSSTPWIQIDSVKHIDQDLLIEGRITYQPLSKKPPEQQIDESS